MADLILSPLIDVVTQKAIEFLKDQYELRSNVRDKLEKLEFTLKQIKAVAATADVDRGKNDNLAAWARKLKNAALDADDVMDEFEYVFLEKQAVKSSTSCLQSPSRYANNFLRSTALKKKLRGIQQELEALLKKADVFINLVNQYKNAQVTGESSTRETSSYTSEPELTGREDKLEEIVQALIEVVDVGGDHHIPILPVVGLGGMGKTTLAQYVYNDSRIVEHFNVRMWVYVSEIFDVGTLTKKMIETASKGEVKFDGKESLETLQGRLKVALQPVSFLLVLDDMWYESENTKEKFKKLFAPLLASARKESKILVTSRTNLVGSLPGAMNLVMLEGLDKHHCWSIIQKCCFNGDVILEGHRDDLMEIGEQIADKVRGSPLAAKTVGRILQKNMNPIFWKNILNTELSDLEENNIMSILRLSYNYLSPHLRQCFAYCSLFPKGFHFNADMLVRMWVAQGYIMHHHRPFKESTDEDVGRIYFDNLLSAGLFTRSEIDKKILHVMHDLVNDLARDVSKDDHLLIEKDILGKQSSDIPDTIRHLSFNTDYLVGLTTNMTSRFTKVRSLLVFRGTSYDDPAEVSTLVGELRRLRVLHIPGCSLSVLPENIACSVHLRYFDLSESWFGRLPSSLCKFYRLQVLSFEGNFGQLIVPEKVWDLDRLRYLAAGRNTILSLDWIGRQTSLQVFRGRIKIEASRGHEELCKFNKGMSRLVEEGSSVSLIICGIENLESSLQAKALADKIPGNIAGLEELVLQWSSDSDSKSGARPPCCDSEVQQEIFKALQPPPSIKDLTISYYKGTMGGPENGSQWFSPHLNKLTVKDCPNLNEMPSIPPHLKLLRVEDSPNLNEMPSVPPSLESLDMWYVGLHSLPELISSSGCPDIAHVADGRCNNTSMTATTQATTTSTSSSSCLIDVDPSSLLRTIDMNNLENLTSLRRGLLHDQRRLKHLRFLSIQQCKQLVSLPDGEFGQLVSLKYLYIINCPNLIWAMPRKEDQEVGGAVLFPPSLELLSISHLQDGVLSIRLQGLCNLSILYIYESPALTSLPSEQELAHLTSLRSLVIKSCKELTPSGMGGLRALLSLKSLNIFGCPTLTSSPNDGGAGDQLGPSYPPVETLGVDDLLLLTMLPVLKTLSSVKELRYDCDSQVLSSFPPGLNDWLSRNATTLRALYFYCKSMKSLPAVLPSSLESLIIRNPHRELQHKLRKDVGQDWHKIRHIRLVKLGSVEYTN